MHFEITLTFNIQFNPMLSNQSSEDYQAFSSSVTDALNSIIATTNLIISSSATLSWSFTPGSTRATVSYVPLVNATSEDAVNEELQHVNVSVPHLTDIKFIGKIGSFLIF